MRDADRAQSPRIWACDDLPLQVRPAIPREAWHLKRTAEQGSRDTHVISDTELRRLKPRFDLLTQKLTALLDPGEPA